MYRQTKRAKEMYSRMGKASARVRAEKALENADPCNWTPPELRREIIIRDHDFGTREYRMELRRSRRIDCYDCYINGELWQSKIGWSRIQEWIRKAFPRVQLEI